MTTATIPMLHPVAGYLRVSTQEQAMFGASVDAQTDRILQAYPTATLYADAGVSAKHPLEDRESGALLLEAVEKGQVKTVVVVKLDRLFRSAVQALSTIERWNRLSVRLVILDHGGEHIDTSGALGKLFFSMLAGFSEFERNMASERTRSTMGYLKDKTWVSKRGKKEVTGFGCPLRHAPETVALVLALATDGLDPEGIVDRMSEPGMPVPPRGGPWTVNTVRGILRRGVR